MVRIYDLTVPLEPGMPVQPGDPPVELVTAATHETRGYEVTQIRLGSHSGTHIDAPRHFLPDGRTLDRFPIERFVGRGVVFDYRADKDSGPDQKLAEQLSHFPIASAGIALLWTEGRSLSLEGAQMLLEAGVGLVGTDSPSIDAEPYQVHRLLLAREVLIAENLRGLKDVGPGLVECALLPLALRGLDGAPIRAVAWR